MGMKNVPTADGAEMILLKEIIKKLDDITDRINRIESVEPENDKADWGFNISLEEEVSDLLRDIGIPAHIIGYQYIREAIMMAAEDMNVINKITTFLYPDIARKFHTTPSRVERAIRHAIEKGWSRGNIETIDRFFGYTIDDEKAKPSNSEFIAIIADNIRLERRRRG